jgi:hypothetical protein
MPFGLCHLWARATGRGSWIWGLGGRVLGRSGGEVGRWDGLGIGIGTWIYVIVCEFI